MEIRELNVKDIFKLTSIIRKMGIRKELLAVPKPKKEDGDTKDTAEGYGIQLIMVVLENLDQAEKDICSFFGDLCGKSADEFKAMSLKELGEFIAELRKVEGLGDFFQSAFKTATES
jgi:hypothetical protein